MFPEPPPDVGKPRPLTREGSSTRQLLGFFVPYVGKYAHWTVVAAVAILTFGVMSGALISLLHPLFQDVLQFQGDVGILPGAGGDATTTDPEIANSLIERLKQPADDLKLWAAGRYEALKAALDIREGNGLRSDLYFVPAILLLVFTLRGIAQFISGYSFQRIGLGVTNDVRNDLYRQIIHQSSRFHAEHTSGELFSRVISDVSKLQVVVSSRLLDLFLQSVALVVYLGVLLSIHFTLAVTCLFVAPVLIFPIVRFGKGMRRTSHKSQERMADLSALLTEGIRGNRVVKAFGMEDFESERFEKATERHLRINLRAQVLASLSSPVVEIMAAVGATALIVSVGRMIRAETISPAVFMQFLTTLFLLYDPIRKLNRVNLVIQEAAAAADRVVQLMAIPNEIVDDAKVAPIDTVRDAVRYESVSFHYQRSTSNLAVAAMAGDVETAVDAEDRIAKAVLDDIDLEIQAGEVVALVGASGAGKSTLVNLLPRFFDPVTGRLTIDGHDIRDLPLANLRSLIGIVTQETLLFNDSVRNNIAYGQKGLALERVREAAAAAYADDFIMELEHGYDTIIGEQGLSLSGGQRQRLAIARALLKDAPILILDEATSHLDTESESLVQRAISNLTTGRTSLVIAHRLSTVTRADRIVVMDRGKIIEQGNHETLLEQGGTYKRLYDLQFKES